MKLLEVTNIQHGCVHDGPGVRTTIFLKGCPFKCPWCCNPETQSSVREYFLYEDRCLKNKKIASRLCNNCERNGGKQPISNCVFNVCEQTYKKLSIDDIVKEVGKESSLYDISHGGITISGGDPLFHGNCLLQLVENLKRKVDSIAIESSLYTNEASFISNLCEYIDEWIVDLKLQPMICTETYIQNVASNIMMLRNNQKHITFRLVCISQMDSCETIKRLKMLNVESLEILKCHDLGRSKYERLNMDLGDYIPSQSFYEEFCNDLSQEGFIITKQSV